MDTTTIMRDAAAAYLRAHSIPTAWGPSGELLALDTYTIKDADGRVVDGSEWRALPLDLRAIRAWLGY